MDTTMGVNFIRSNLENPARTYLWESVITPPVSIMDGSEMQFLIARCRSSQVPNEGFNTIRIPWRATAGIVLPGRVNLDHTISFRFIEDVGGMVRNVLSRWVDAITDKLHGVSGLNDVQLKGSVLLKLLSKDGGVGHSYVLDGVFPSSVDKVTLTYDSDTVVEYGVTFSYDVWRYGEDAGRGGFVGKGGVRAMIGFAAGGGVGGGRGGVVGGVGGWLGGRYNW